MKNIPTWIAALWLAMSATAPGALAQTHPAAQPSAITALAPDKARAALDILKDDAQRARLITVLEAIAQVSVVQGPVAQVPITQVPATGMAGAHPATPAVPPQAALPVAPPVALPAAEPAKAPVVPAPAIVLAPNSVGAQLLVGVSETITELSDRAVNLVHTVNDFPLLWNWVRRLSHDQQMQRAIFDAVWRMVLVLGLGIGAEWVARRALRAPIETVRERAANLPGELEPGLQGIADAEAGQTEWVRRRTSAVNIVRRLPYVAACFSLDLLPVLAVIAVGYILLAFGMAGGLTSRLVILAVLNAYVAWRLMVSIVRAVASPDSLRLRLISVGDASAAVMVREVGHLGAVAVGGYALAEAALLFGLYQQAHDALLKLNALIVYVLVVNIVLRNRRGLKLALRASEGRTGFFAALRNVVATSWHRLIIFYLGALWLVWALDIEDGFSRLLHMMLAAVIVSVSARLLGKGVKALLDRVMKEADGLDRDYPGMEARLHAYYPIARGLLDGVIALTALVVLFQAWGIEALFWFTTGGVGGRVITAFIAIAATLLIALAVWELVNAAIARHLAHLARNAQLARSARLRTLLPMFRTSLLVTVSLMAGLLILSEIGVNIAPLLAGAGVVGLAIGFGSQKLVQDIITGLFLLLENAMQVGDVVTLGGMTGTVENLSIRTIRLRALDGSVHIVPFSAVTTVTNSTRDYGFAVADVSVGLNEEPDHISDTLKDVASVMRTEAPWRGLILADLEVMGVEKFIDTAWVMRVRIKTLPASRWAVGRELNRRIKYRFDEMAIESPMTSYRALSMAPLPLAADSGAATTVAAAALPAGSSPLSAPPV